MGKTAHYPLALIFEIKKIEALMGRGSFHKKTYYEDRIIDIDILFYENYIIKSSCLFVPHPQLHKRAFVMFPCMELLPDFIHPVFNKSVKEIFEENRKLLLSQKIKKIGSL